MVVAVRLLLLSSVVAEEFCNEGPLSGIIDFSRRLVRRRGSLAVADDYDEKWLREGGRVAEKKVVRSELQANKEEELAIDCQVVYGGWKTLLANNAGGAGASTTDR